MPRRNQRRSPRLGPYFAVSGGQELPRAEGVGGISAIGADLAIWFDANQAYKSSGGGVVTPASILTVARASAGSYFDSAGILQQATNDTLRLDYNPTTLAPLGVLIEEQRTNLLTYSQDFSNAAWTKTAVSASFDAGVSSPFGIGSYAITRTSAATAYIRESVTVAAGNTVTASIIAKAKSVGGLVGLRIQGTYPDRIDVVADLNAGTITYSAVGGVYTTPASTITALGGSWYKITATVTTVTSAVTFVVAGPTIVSGNLWEAASATLSDCYILCTQLEVGAFPTSYIPTVASQVTRAGDRISIATSAFPYNASAGTMVCRGDTYTQVATPHFASLSGGTISNRFLFRADSGAQFFCITGGGVVAQLDNGTVTVNTETGLAAAFALDDYAASLKGAAPAVDALGAMPVGINVLYIGGRGDGDITDGVLNGHLKRLAYYASRKTNAELQVLST